MRAFEWAMGCGVVSGLKEDWEMLRAGGSNGSGFLTEGGLRADSMARQVIVDGVQGIDAGNIASSLVRLTPSIFIAINLNSIYHWTVSD